jgi:hypothetical protein
MSVFVDDVRHQFGRMVMCHMWADTEEELHKMAEKIGIQRKWFQCPPKASWKHYDISLSKKKEAISLGAILTDKYGPVEFLAKQRGDMKKIEQIRNIRSKRNEGILRFSEME